MLSPSAGLKTYNKFAVDLTPTDGPDGNALPINEVKAAKARRRKMIQTFTNEGEPGASMAPHVTRLTKALQCPESAAGADAELLEQIGLSGGSCILLPSFLRLLRELKQRGRTFSVCFRTFGKDLPKIVEEYNCLCEGNHPYFLDEAPRVVMDGSDGGADLRMNMASSEVCLTNSHAAAPPPPPHHPPNQDHTTHFLYSRAAVHGSATLQRVRPASASYRW